ncbi:MAG: DoxX family protein [Chitinophagaceae bacterium]|nr:MAG: DoxX family protein [Chitinophagaceae bacterium]
MKIKTRNRLLLIPKLIAAAIMLQTLFFKFSASPESVYIFSAIGLEPWGRIVSGIMELIAAVMILIPATSAVGALLGIGIMAGALVTHFTTIGLVVMGDGGLLFGYCLLVLACCLFIAIAKRSQLNSFLPRSKSLHAR